MTADWRLACWHLDRLTEREQWARVLGSGLHARTVTARVRHRQRREQWTRRLEHRWLNRMPAE